MRQFMAPLDLPANTELYRWGYPAVTARWERNGTHFNIQALVSGGPLAYVADFDGASWQDDEAALRRRIVWVPGPFVRFADATVQVPWTRDVLGDLIAFGRLLTSDDVATQLNNAPWEYLLTPYPDLPEG